MTLLHRTVGIICHQGSAAIDARDRVVPNNAFFASYEQESPLVQRWVWIALVVVSVVFGRSH